MALEKGNGTDSIHGEKRRFRLCLKLSCRSLDFLPAPSSSPGKRSPGWKRSCDLIINPFLQSRRVLTCPSSFFIWKSSSDFPLRGSALTKSIQNSHLHIYFSMTFSSYNQELSVQELGGWTRQLNPFKHNPFTSKESDGVILSHSAALAFRNFQKIKGFL